MKSEAEHAIVREILALEKTRWDLLVANDLDRFESLLADDLVYVHTTGRVDSKASLMELRGAGPVQFLRFEHSDALVRVLAPTVAVLTADIRNWQFVEGRERAVHNRFTGVWVKTSRAWRLASYHATKASPPAA